MAIRVTRHVVLDASNLEAHLHDFAKVLGKDLGEVVREQAGLFCMDLVKYTRPFSSAGKGLDSASKKKGEENVFKALQTIFRPVSAASKQQVSATRNFEVFKLWMKDKGAKASSFSKQEQWDMFQKRNPAGRAIAYVGQDTTAMSRIHKGLRKYSGKGGLLDYAKKAKSPFAIVRKESDIKKYAKLKAKEVGSLKSGYWFASQKIRAKEVRAPAWIKHAAGQSYAIGIDQIQQLMKPEVTVGNNVGRRAMPSGLLKSAINYRMYAMRVKMAAELNKRAIPLWSASASGLTTNTSKFF